MSDFHARLLRQEVNELTFPAEARRGWADVRQFLASKGLPGDRVILAGFMEDSDDNEFGVIVTPKMKVFEYQRNTSGDKSNLTKWREVTNLDELRLTFPAVRVGLEIARESQEP